MRTDDDKQVVRTENFLYIFKSDGEAIEIKDVSITKDRYIYADKLEERPLEDCGDFLLSAIHLEHPLDIFLDILEKEGN